MSETRFLLTTEEAELHWAVVEEVRRQFKVDGSPVRAYFEGTEEALILFGTRRLFVIPSPFDMVAACRLLADAEERRASREEIEELLRPMGMIDDYDLEGIELEFLGPDVVIRRTPALRR